MEVDQIGKKIFHKWTRKVEGIPILHVFASCVHSYVYTLNGHFNAAMWLAD